MLKASIVGILGCIVPCGMAAASGVKVPPPTPPVIRYQLPPAITGYAAGRLPEGRSVYRTEVAGTFWLGVDERGAHAPSLTYQLPPLP